jgi:NTP pyrophosphatase (non-canonical NTP hydrolase)
MTFDEYQTAAARTLNLALDADDRLLDAASGLAEEAGEILAHIRKHRFQGRARNDEELILELGDALWCIAALAGTLGVRLGDVGARNIEKLSVRHSVGFRPDQG